MLDETTNAVFTAFRDLQALETEAQKVKDWVAVRR